MDAFGFKASDYESDAIEVWPENWDVVQIFTMLGTQWRQGMGGVTGLDYTAVKSVFEMFGVKKKKWAKYLIDIGMMESAALSEIHKGK